MEISINTAGSSEEFLMEHHGVFLYLKRDDLIHPEISGNKWRKLKYHAEEFYAGSYDSLLTFGGAFSNHLAATAAFARLAEIPAYGLIRGEEEMDNPTLRFCRTQGMELEGISRSKYQVKDKPEFLEALKILRPNVFIIPEGGKGPQAVKGCAEIRQELEGSYDYFALAAGTGATAAGLLAALEHEQLLVYPALKAEGFMVKAIVNQLLEYYRYYGLKGKSLSLIQRELVLRPDYHFGGYAKINEDLIRFMNTLYQSHQLKLDPVYTSKMLFGLLKDIEAGQFKLGAKILVLHTGGLQGIAGMNEKLSQKGQELISYD